MEALELALHYCLNTVGVLSKQYLWTRYLRSVKKISKSSR